MVRSFLAYCLALSSPFVLGQPVPAALVPYTRSEVIGLAMNKAQVMEAVKQAWDISFGQEPGAKRAPVDEATGTLEGSARVNYRSKLLVAREETMGPISYSVSILAQNGQCTIRVHNVKHAGDRNAPNGGLNLGVLMEGPAPLTHYSGYSGGVSRKIHADALKVVSARVEELLRALSAKLRSLNRQ
jgi:hypothetical protein